ncbi:unnamed protein product, partial [marine sediment metagenome]
MHSALFYSSPKTLLESNGLYLHAFLHLTEIGTIIALFLLAMRVMVPISQDRISPVLDVAEHFLLVDLTEDSELGRLEVHVENTVAQDRAMGCTGLRPG